MDERELAWHRGKIEIDAGNRVRAINDLEESVRLTPAGHIRLRYAHLAHLMEAQVRAGAWSDAEETAHRLTNFSGIIDSGRVTVTLEQACIVAQRSPHAGKGNVVSAIRDGLGISV
jgi:hypothetical protein